MRGRGVVTALALALALQDPPPEVHPDQVRAAVLLAGWHFWLRHERRGRRHRQENDAAHRCHRSGGNGLLHDEPGSHRRGLEENDLGCVAGALHDGGGVLDRRATTFGNGVQPSGNDDVHSGLGDGGTTRLWGLGENGAGGFRRVLLADLAELEVDLGQGCEYLLRRRHPGQIGNLVHVKDGRR